MVRAYRWPRGVVSLLVVCMLSLGPFAQGVDMGLEIGTDSVMMDEVEPPASMVQPDARELLSNIDGFFTENLEQNVDGQLATEEPDYRVGTRVRQLCNDSEIVMDYEAFPTIAGAATSKVLIFYSNAGGTGYKDHTSISTTQVKGACLEDLDADGYIDLIVADQTGPSRIYWSDDQGAYSSSDKSDLTTSRARRVAAGDLNNDGWPDLVISSESGGNSTIFFNQEGSFQSQPDITFARQNDAFVNIEDMNDDGYNDLVFGEWAGDETRIFYGGPDGPDTTVDVTLAGGWTRVRDLDQDGYFDVFASDGSSIKVYLGSPTGPSTSPDYTLTTSNAAQYSDAGDLNGDGYIDIVCVVSDASNPNKVCIFEGASDGWSTSRIHDDIVHDRYFHTTVEDINKDGYADIIMDDESNPQLNIFFGGTSWPTTPDITKPLSARLYDIAIAIPKGAPINATISSEPQNLTLEPGDRSIRLKWDAPNDTGGVNLVRYNIYRGMEVDNLTKLAEVGRTITSYTDRPPRAGVVYHYAVTAFNIKGESNRSAIVNATNTGRPLEPGLRIYGVGCETLSVAWDPPIDTGGFPILGYTLYRGDTSLDTSQYADLGNVTEYMDEGLENGRTYYYRVLAINRIGEGPLSDVVSGMPLGPPSAPRYLTATASDGQIDIEWRPPLHEGGSSVIGYRIHRGPTEDDLVAYQTVDFLETSYSDKGLTNGETYHYAVRTFNEIGESPLSNFASGTPLGLPGVPGEFRAETSDGRVTLTWVSPQDTGGTDILRYQLLRGTSDELLMSLNHINADLTEYVDRDLMNGQTFYYALYAINAVGDGPRTDIVEATPLALPDAPGDLIAERGNGLITISWLRPLDDGGAEVTKYRIYRGLSDADLEFYHAVAKSTFTYSDADVDVGTTYHYAITAVTVAGESSLSIIAIGTSYGLPGATNGFVATSGNQEVRLTWSPPEDDGASPIEGYVILRGTSAGDIRELTQLGPVSSYLDTSVINGETYFYVIAAINEAGPGDYTEPVPATPERPDTEPGNNLGLLGTPSKTKVVLEWSAPTDDGGSPVTGYLVMRGESDDDLQVVATLGTVTSWTDEDVKGGKTYYYAVRAVNDVGQGDPCATFEAKVPKEAESPGFEVVLVMMALLCIIPIVRRRG